MGQEQRREGAVVLKQSDHRPLVDADHTGVFDDSRCGQMHWLPGETLFPQKTSWLQDHDDRFFAPPRHDSQLDFTGLDIEHGI